MASFIYVYSDDGLYYCSNHRGRILNSGGGCFCNYQLRAVECQKGGHRPRSLEGYSNVYMEKCLVKFVKCNKNGTS